MNRPLLMMAALLGIAARASDSAYRDEIARWRAQREESLRSETGWLALAGLFWLEPGASTFGSNAANDIVLPEGAPAHAGKLTFTGDAVSVELAPDVAAALGDRAVSGTTALPINGTPLRLGRLSLHAIRRADRYGIRLRDPESALRRDFKGLAWFPTNESFRVVGRFVPDEKPATVSITNVLGQTREEPSPGSVELELSGQTLRLRPYIEDGDTSQWFFVFKDKTAPKETYGGGRFVYSEPAKDGRVVVDFNKAYNPPCAFNPYTTCPMPPKENQLPVAVRAGEKTPPK